MLEKGQINNIDIQLYSRQLGIIDIEIMKKLTSIRN